MRYHYQKPSMYASIFGETYCCNHPVYSSCTLFRMNDKGLAVIQQRYNSETKTTTWTELDPWLPNDLYLHPKFKQFFDERSGTCTDGLYPTVTVRQMMWALKMKPLRREQWETVFDRKYI